MSRILQATKHRSVSLRGLLWSLFAASVLVICVLVLIASGWLKKAAVEDLAEQHGQEFAELVFQNLYLVMSGGGDRSDIEEAIQELRRAKENHIIRIVPGPPIIEQYGGDTPEEALGAMDPLLRSAMERGREAVVITDDNIRYLFPVVAEPRCLVCHQSAEAGDVNGVIDIVHPVEDVHVPLNFMLTVAVLFGVVFSGILLFTIHANLRFFVVGPLQTMDRVIRDIITDTNLTRRVESSSQISEIGGLSSSFNQLLESIEDYNRQLETLSSKDPLTKLNNREKFLQDITAEIQYAEPLSKPFAVLVIDLDHFGFVNDTHGHPLGDLILMEIADLLRQRLVEQESIARIGEDEYGVILPGFTLRDARRTGVTLRDAIHDLEFQTDDGTVRVTASVGVVCYPRHGTTTASLIAAGDVAIYKARKLGRNQVITVEKSEVKDVAKIHGRDVWLRQAIADGKVELFGQSIVDLKDNRVMGIEVLTRVRDGDRLVSPAGFISDLERYGRVEELDRYVLETTLDAKRRVRGLDGIKVFVNLSAATVEDHVFMDTLTDLLDERGVRAEELVLEITERQALRQLATISGLIRRLRSQGIGFALDDFGSGFNSFLYLKYFPVDYVKIEGSFVQQAAISRRDRLIVEHIHRVARAMGVETIAERVEDESVHELMRGLGIEFGQGYYYRAPRMLDELVQSLPLVEPGVDSST